MVGAKLIILNTVVSYGRSVLSAGLALFSTRWILAALGEVDYGLYFTVGGIIIFISFINTSMTLTTQRYLSYAVGNGGGQEVRAWFNASLFLHLIIGAFFLLLSIPVGVIMFKYFLKIPEGRNLACVWVYFSSVVTTVGLILSVPYTALYYAYQKIYELTIIQMIQVLLLFVLSWCILYSSEDRLIIYALGTTCINILIYIVQIIRSRIIFPESSVDVSKMVSRSKIVALMSFSGWNIASTFGFLVRGQGIALLLNNFGAPGVNASYSIANNLAGQAGFLANGFMNAVTPAISSAEGAGDRARMISLATSSSKYAITLALFLVLPIFSDVECLLSVWLKDVPQNTECFVRLMMVMYLCMQSVLGVSVANKAYGKIALPQMLSAFFLALAIPLGYMAVQLSLPMSYVVGTAALTQGLCAGSTLFSAYYLYRYPVMDWFNHAFLRNFIVIIPCVIITLIVHRLMTPIFLRFVIVAIIDCFIIIGMGYFFVLTKEERDIVLKKVMRR